MQLPSLMEGIVTCLLLMILGFQLKYWYLYLYFILMKFQLIFIFYSDEISIDVKTGLVTVDTRTKNL
jgi:hypothetical protein